MNYNCMLELGLRNYDMELGFYDLFTSYEMELETNVHAQIENQLGFMNYKLHSITRVDKL